VAFGLVGDILGGVIDASEAGTSLNVTLVRHVEWLSQVEYEKSLGRSCCKELRLLSMRKSMRGRESVGGAVIFVRVCNNDAITTQL